jgi:hypothetical protein
VGDTLGLGLGATLGVGFLAPIVPGSGAPDCSLIFLAFLSASFVSFPIAILITS